jgi:hypothetical protein
LIGLQETPCWKGVVSVSCSAGCFKASRGFRQPLSVVVHVSPQVNLKPLLAVGGAGGIAAGFASQQLLLNVVAGVNIFLTRPFIGGDQVRWLAKPASSCC